MKFVIRLLALSVLLLLPPAGPAFAQYMWLDSNANQIHDTGDRLNAVGVATTVDVYLDTDSNRDGTTATCDTGSEPLSMNSFVVNLQLSTGTVGFTNYINRMAGPPWNFTNLLGDTLATTTRFSVGQGSGTYQVPGTYFLLTVTATLLTNPTADAALNIVGSGLAPDPTSFGTECFGNDFLNTYVLGPNATGTTDWTDADGLAPPPVVGGTPVVNNPGNQTVNEGSLLAYTVTATDPDAGQTLTFTLGAGAPTGAAITSGGAFTWTPSEAQGPGTYPVTYQATDNGTPPLTGGATNTITVNEVNQAPVVTNPGNRTVNEGSTLVYTLVVTDADLPPQSITWALGAGAPTGATIGTATGAFSWTPSEVQGPGTYPITYNATDDATPPMTGSATNTITVNEVNVAPVVTNPGNRTTNEGVLLAYTVTATDADVPVQTLTFTLGAGAPAGAGITAGGAFTWTPAEFQGPGTFPISYVATDNGTPSMNGSVTNTITVNEVNTAPAVNNPGNQVGQVGVLLTYTVTATDGDLPAQTLAFTLGAGAPTGAAITSGGVFTWTPVQAQIGAFPVTYTATDNGTPPMSGSATNTITVGSTNAAPVVANPGNRTVNEGTLLAYTVTATDADGGQTLTFTLGPGAPTGAASTTGGAFSWTPSEAQGPGTFPITYVATDNGAPPLSGNATNTVTVNEVNVAPVVNAPANQTVNEGTAIAYTVTATDADLPAQPLAFTLGAGAPTGAAISPGGAFNWTPSEAQGPGTYPITYTATDNGTPPMAGSATNTITVNEANNAPVVANPGNRTVNEGSILAYTVTATDSDTPAQTISFEIGRAHV